VKTRWMPSCSAVWAGLAAWALIVSAAAPADDPPRSIPPSDGPSPAVLSDGQPAPQSAQKPGECELILEGSHIESLVFQYQGQRKVVETTGPSVYLPPGQYLLQEVHFQGGLTIQPYQAFILEPKVPFRLNYGKAMKPRVVVKRDGRLLKLDFQLLDSNGQNLAASYRSTPPEFAVYLGGEKIGSGTFKYG
jgi:hypothetical protein